MSSKIIATDRYQKNYKNFKKGDKDPSPHIQVGECQFPFMYYEHPDKKGPERGKMIEWNTCVDSSKGKWCATQLTPKRGIKKMGYCPEEEAKVEAKATSPPEKKTKKISRPRSPSSKKQPKILKIVSAFNDKPHLPPAINQVVPPVWELPNRKTFPVWVDSTYKKYKIPKVDKSKCADPKECQVEKRFDLFSHQKFVRDYLQAKSPYRGILLYHGLGIGKTCASIAIAEGFKSDIKIFVILNKSLKQNFKINLMRCGDEYVRLNQHWVFHKITGGSNDKLLAFGVSLGIPKGIILKNKGIWLIDFTKKENYKQLSSSQVESLHSQINTMIDSRYEFIHLNGLTSKKLKEMKEKRILDNSILIIDEVHNLTNGMAKAHPGVRARYLENLIMQAKNLRLVFLSGTPMINNLFEIGKVFNLLRGYIKTFTFILKPVGAKQASFTDIGNELSKHELIDQYFVKSKEKTVSITRVPENYVNSDKGLVLTDSNISEDKFLEIMGKFFKDRGYGFSYTPVGYTALPNEEGEFMRFFFNEHTNELKNMDLFKSRILGLVSHYASRNETDMPQINKSEVVEVPMSDYQFLKYSGVRKDEIEQDKSRKKQGSKSKKAKATGDSPSESGAQGNLFETKSSYRAYSRMHCSFVFPETIPRPTPGSDEESMKIDEFDEEVMNSQDDVLEEEEKLASDKKRRLLLYETAKNRALQQLDTNKNDFLVKNEAEKLEKYSPKYNHVINKIHESPGNVFVYTEYRTLEGIATLQIVLKANGFAPFLLNKDGNTWKVNYEHPDDVHKPKYAFWGADEETSDIILKVFNNEKDKVPASIRDEIFVGDSDNIRGDIIKVLLTTKKGAEGISLRNVRQVHIIEPYWNPVRLEQVEGRAIRVGSHLQLPPKDRNVDVYTYLSVMTPKQLKSDRILQDDGGGKSSDQVLYEISNKKLQIMNALLKVVKEVSIDCGLNIVETQNPKEPHTCVNYGSASRNKYAYVPNIMSDIQDDDRGRLYATTSWKPVLIEIKGVKYALRERPGEADLIYDYEDTQSGRPGEPIGEIRKVMNKSKTKLISKLHLYQENSNAGSAKGGSKKINIRNRKTRKIRKY